MTAAMEAAVDTAEMGVASLVTKRVRALRKKLDKAVRAESSATEGKPLNVEQQALVSSKASLEALADELEKLRPALLEAVAAERAAERALAPPPVDPKLAESSSRKLAALQKVPGPPRARARVGPALPLPVRSVAPGGLRARRPTHRPPRRCVAFRLPVPPAPPRLGPRTRIPGRGVNAGLRLRIAAGVGGIVRPSQVSDMLRVRSSTRRSSQPRPLREIVRLSQRCVCGSWDSTRSPAPANRAHSCHSYRINSQR